ELAGEGGAGGGGRGGVWGDRLGQCRGWGEGQGRGVLDRGGGGGPDLAGDPEHSTAQGPPARAVRQPGGPGPPAAEGEALAQGGRHHGALGNTGSRTEERRR